MKNEAQNVNRLLTSAAALASEYVVVDTGSTDATVDDIRAHPMPGHVVDHPFVDFSDARNKSLESARILSTAEFFLLMDADMELVLGDLGALRQALEDADVAMVIQTHDGQGTTVLSYQNIRIVRRSLAEAKYVGPTHEYLDVPPEARIATIPESVLRIRDIGDGGCKQNKFERDIRLLAAHLTANPNDPRSTFYLGESYYYGGFVEKALEAYRLRMTMVDGWEQETWCARYRAISCLVSLGRLDEACDLLPEKDTRAEPLLVVARALREAGMHQEAFYLTTRARAVPAPATSALFVERNVYSYGIDGEAAVLWYYVSPPTDRSRRGIELSWRVLCNPEADEATWWCVHNNLEWYLNGPPVGTRVVRAEDLPEPPLVEEPWSISTPSPIGNDGVLYRIVNYNITDNGSYTMPEDGIVRTRNFLGGRGFLVDPAPPFPDANVRGFEDLRITRDPVTRRFFILAATRDHCPRGDSVSQALLSLNPATLELTVERVLSDGSRCEKNWVWLDYPHYIYEWFPRVVIRSVLDEADVRHIPSLPCMRAMRGSSNACVIDGLVWFVTHSVIGGEKSIRHYVHYLVALDLDESRVVHVTPPFTFEEGADVEYCIFLRATDEGRAFLAGYSKRDGTHGVGWAKLGIPVF